MARVAVLIDLSFFLMQYRKLKHPTGQPLIASKLPRLYGALPVHTSTRVPMNFIGSLSMTAAR